MTVVPLTRKSGRGKVEMNNFRIGYGGRIIEGYICGWGLGPGYESTKSCRVRSTLFQVGIHREYEVEVKFGKEQEVTEVTDAYRTPAGA